MTDPAALHTRLSGGPSPSAGKPQSEQRLSGGPSPSAGKPRSKHCGAGFLSQLTTWLRLSRLSNGLTIITNVIAGATLVREPPFSSRTLILSAALLAFYAAGMLLNDYMDRDIDRTERPDRPIPSGKLAPRRVLLYGSALLVLGMLGLLSLGESALIGGAILVAFILIYNRIHKRTATGALVMGLCRYMAYVIPVAALSEAYAPTVLLMPLIPAAYVVLVTLLARREAKSLSPPAIATLPLFLPPLAVLIMHGRLNIIAATMALISLAWTSQALSPAFERPPRTGQSIGRLLAGICIIDALVISLSGHMGATIFALGAFLLTRQLQKLIPAS